MRILYHHRTRGEDAQGVHISALCAAFEALGHRVDRVAPLERRGAGEAGGSAGGTAGEWRPTLAGVAIPHWLYEGLALGYNAAAFAGVLAAALRRRPDFLYERYTLFSFAGLLVARLLRRPLILEVNAPLSLELQRHGALVFRGLAQRIEDWLCRSATRTVVVSHAMAEIFTARGVPRERLLVVPNGVDGERFHPGVDGGPVRRRYALEGCRVVGFVGWIRPWHGVEGLLQAAAPLVAADPGLRLLLVGDGPAVAGLRRQARRLGIEDRVVFTGAVARDEIPAHIAALDIAVQPDVTDYASPIKLFEYLAVGRAVVAPDKPNIREVVRDGVSAELFAPGQWPQLGERLARLLADPERRRRLGERAAERIAEGGYTWLGNARRVIEAVAAEAPVSSVEGT